MKFPFFWDSEPRQCVITIRRFGTEQFSRLEGLNTWLRR